MKRRTASSLPALALALVLTAAPAAASPPLPPDTTTAAVATPVFGGYWQGFVEHWGGTLQKQNGVVMAALGVGAIALFIITRGKWKK